MTTTDQQAVTVAQDITRNPASIWLSPICDDTAHHGEGRTWAAPAPAETCEDCSKPWVEYVRSDLASVSSASAEGPVDADEFETVEAWEHDDQRQLSLLYNHAAHDRPQFNRIQMRQAIRHGKSLAASPEPVPATNQAGEVEKAYTAGFEQGWEWPRETSPTEAAERYARGYVATLATQPATSQETETMNQKYPVPKNATELSAAVAILLADEPSELKPACKLMPQGFRCTLGAEHVGPCSVLAEASAEGVVGQQSWQPIATADRYGFPSLDLYDPAHANEYGASCDGYWNDADGTDHPETGGHWVGAVWCNSCSEWHATRINPTHWRLRPAAPVVSEQAS
jgi:hypothetical protein